MSYYYQRNRGASVLAGALACLSIATSSLGAPIGEQALRIVTLQGEGAVNDTKSKTITEPVVEVRDSRELPVADAEVIFQLPTMGPSGLFPDRSRILKTKTNSQGQAMAAGYLPNEETGRFNIKVTATSAGRTAMAIIAQSNARDFVASERKISKSRSRRWKILAIVGGAAVTGGIVAATRGGSSAPPPAVPVISVSTGPITVGGPH